MPITLRDIGRELGLSPATISRALNGFPEVGQSTRLRVLEAATRLNYKPDPVARKLVTGRSGLIGFIVHRSAQLETDTTFFNVIGGISAALAARQKDLLLHVATDEDIVAPYRRLVALRTMDGFIVNAPRPNDPRIAFLLSEGVPFVVHGRSDEDAAYPYFDIDNRQVSRLAVELLSDLGHQGIGLLNGPAELAYTADRRRGFEEAARERSVRGVSLSGPMSEDFGYISTLRLTSMSNDAPPTALICSSTLVARGVYRAIRDRGLRVPDAVSVVAHDDGVPGAGPDSFDPPLTVTQSPFTAACTPLAEIMIAALNADTSRDALQRVETPQVILGRSVGPVAPLGL